MSEGLVLVVLLGVSLIFAKMMAFGGAPTFLAGASGSVSMVFARFDVVRLASVIGSVKAAGDQAFAMPKRPSGSWKTSVATKPASEAACQKVFGGNVDLDFVVLGVNAHTIGHGRGSSKGPTRSTPSLVPNHGDGLTVGPFLPRVEFFRDLLVP